MSEQKPIELGKQYRTRDGQRARVICADAKYLGFPVIALIGNDLAENAVWCSACGRFGIGDSGLDLIEVRPRIKRKVWLNVYADDGAARCYRSEVEAHLAADASQRLACVEVEIDVEEGHGL